jgi:hypothetical protein
MDSIITPSLLETIIHRELLDFDDDVRGSVTFSTDNLDVCLTCGQTFSLHPLRAHFLSSLHSLVLRLSDLAFLALPDFATVPDFPELEGIRFCANPRYDSDRMREMAATQSGLYGLVTLVPSFGRTAALRLLAAVDPIRDLLLFNDFTGSLSSAFSWFFRRLFNPFHFRASVSPAKLLRNLPESDDPFLFLCAALNGLNRELGEPNAVGEALRSTLRIVDAESEGVKESRVWMLPVELNDSPLYRSGIEKEQLIPHVKIEELLRRFDGVTITAENREGIVLRKRFSVVKAARFVILNLNRVRKNEFVTEKSNVHVVMQEVVEFSGREWKIKAIIAHEGDAISGTYLAFVKNRSNGRWFRCQGTDVREVLFEVAATAQCCFLLFESSNAS